MGSDAARKRPNIPSKFLNSSTTVLKGQPLPESPLILCNKDKAAIKLIGAAVASPGRPASSPAPVIQASKQR
ncbi:NAD kinase [Trichinella spiralis]|uniref:NAD kinase n=1 Tax=Trichinella spiralis TaxID=6334 RepID=A0ABR3KZD9_TRISP